MTSAQEHAPPRGLRCGRTCLPRRLCRACVPRMVDPMLCRCPRVRFVTSGSTDVAAEPTPWPVGRVLARLEVAWPGARRVGLDGSRQRARSRTASIPTILDAAAEMPRWRPVCQRASVASLTTGRPAVSAGDTDWPVGAGASSFRTRAGKADVRSPSRPASAFRSVRRSRWLLAW
jgi:hypothetical protein